ncbi:MAG: acylphosphatase [Candidatus Aenigmarchaeota archaeon]|nr:acylphosphatase [Candidatus Aenigmarchaeota archaeon]
MKRCHILVSGLVQGVFFRDFTRKNALELKLTGWVRNTQDNRVEVFAEGEENKIKELIKRLWQGPPAAKVSNVSVEWQEPKKEFISFSIIR